MPTVSESQINRTPLANTDGTASASVPKAQRIPALDFTKGALVLIMVLYHWINYFIGPQWAYYEYLRFLTPSFIFISGFIISHVYLSKYHASDPRLSKRLLIRGVKLLGVFLFLNLARIFVGPLLGSGAAMQNLPSLKDLFTIFVSGNYSNVGSKLVSFSILVPISYLLMLSGVLVLLYRVYRYTFHLACVFLLSSIAIMGLVWGARSYCLEFITIGMLGVQTGFFPITSVNRVIRHPYLLALAYLCYVIAITIWNVAFLLLIVGVLLSLSVIYLAGDSGGDSSALNREVILLGKYSLFGYISQIAILQILSASSHRVNLGFPGLVLSFVAAFVLTIVSVEVVDRARARTAPVDRLYKVVFA